MNTFNPKVFDPKEAILHRMRYYASRSSFPMAPNLATIQFLRARTHPMHQMHYVKCEDTMGQPCFYICFLNQNEDGSWSVQTTLGGYESERVQSPALQGLPWIDLRGGQRSRPGGQGQGALHEFYAGGEIIDNGLGIVRVRLIEPSGHVLEDTVQDGLVLFWEDQYIGLPLTAELYNQANELVSSQPVLSVPPPESLSPERFQGTFRPLR